MSMNTNQLLLRLQSYLQNFAKSRKELDDHYEQRFSALEASQKESVAAMVSRELRIHDSSGTLHHYQDGGLLWVGLTRGTGSPSQGGTGNPNLRECPGNPLAESILNDEENVIRFIPRSMPFVLVRIVVKKGYKTPQPEGTGKAISDPVYWLFDKICAGEVTVINEQIVPGFNLTIRISGLPME